MRRFSNLLRDTKAATAVEYGLIIAMIVLAMIGALRMLATSTTLGSGAVGGLFATVGLDEKDAGHRLGGMEFARK